MIRLLTAKNICYAQIHHQLVEVYGEFDMNKGNVNKWFVCLFNAGRTDMHNGGRPAFPSDITKDLKARVDAHIR